MITFCFHHYLYRLSLDRRRPTIRLAVVHVLTSILKFLPKLCDTSQWGGTSATWIWKLRQFHAIEGRLRMLTYFPWPTFISQNYIGLKTHSFPPKWLQQSASPTLVSRQLGSSSGESTDSPLCSKLTGSRHCRIALPLRFTTTSKRLCSYRNTKIAQIATHLNAESFWWWQFSLGIVSDSPPSPPESQSPKVPYASLKKSHNSRSTAEIVARRSRRHSGL